MQVRWLFWLYGKRNGGNFEDVTNIDVVAGDYETALAKAQALVPLELKGTEASGAGYVLRSVTETES